MLITVHAGKKNKTLIIVLMETNEATVYAYSFPIQIPESKIMMLIFKSIYLTQYLMDSIQ